MENCQYVVYGVDITDKLPEPTSFKYLSPEDLPALKGSEKQVKWAEDIRIEAAIKLSNEFAKRNGLKTDADHPNNKKVYDLKNSKKAMAESIENNTLVQSAVRGGNEKIIAEKILNAANHFMKIANQVNRTNELLSNDSAKFWIDNRSDQANNYMYKKFISCVFEI